MSKIKSKKTRRDGTATVTPPAEDEPWRKKQIVCLRESDRKQLELVRAGRPGPGSHPRAPTSRGDKTSRLQTPPEQSPTAAIDR
jgi:hypothetical protein